MNEVFNDRNKYQRLSEDPTKKLQRINNNIVKRLADGNYIEKWQRRKLGNYISQVQYFELF